MTAATANRITQLKNTQNAIYTEYPVEAGETIYQGCLVMVDTDGYLTLATDTTNCKVVGIADEYVVNSGADGAAFCRVVSNVTARLAASSVAISDFDAPLMYVVDNQTVDETSPANSVKAGIHVPPHISTTEAWVFIPPYGMFTYGL